MTAITGVPPSITTPDTVQSRLGTLKFDDGAPTPDTAERLYDNLDFMRAVEAYLNSIQGASLVAIRRGFKSVGVEDNEFLMYPELMDSASLFPTANADTICSPIRGRWTSGRRAARRPRARSSAPLATGRVVSCIAADIYVPACPSRDRPPPQRLERVTISGCPVAKYLPAARHEAQRSRPPGGDGPLP